jgi:hypothetical protein
MPADTAWRNGRGARRCCLRGPHHVPAWRGPAWDPSATPPPVKLGEGESFADSDDVVCLTMLAYR